VNGIPLKHSKNNSSSEYVPVKGVPHLSVYGVIGVRNDDGEKTSFTPLVVMTPICLRPTEETFFY